MSSGGITLRFFFFGDSGAAEREALGPVDDSPVWDKIRETLDSTKGVDWPNWSLLSKEIRAKIGEILDTDLGKDILAVWTKYHEIRKYRNSEGPNFVTLVDHEFETSCDPYIEILINEKPVGRLTFNVEVALGLKGVILDIQEGNIRKIHSGSCAGIGRLALGGQTLVEVQSREFILPGRLDLGEGIPIL